MPEVWDTNKPFDCHSLLFWDAVCVYIYMCICILIYACIHTYAYTHICVCIYIERELIFQAEGK